MSQYSSNATGSSTSILLSLVTAYMASRVVHVAAELRIADLLADGAKSGEILAHETKAHTSSLRRLLRSLSSLGLVNEIEQDQFALTPLGDELRTGRPNSLRGLALMFGGERAWQSWGGLLHSVLTGESATQHIYGMGSFEYLAARPQEAAIFNAAMSDLTRRTAQAVVAAYDFSRFGAIVDLGGGDGTLMSVILAATPKPRGVVFDLPNGNAEAAQHLAAAGLTERCGVIAGDFFRSVPSGADAYILKSVIHDWDDDRSVVILKNCRNAISPIGKLLLVERVMPERMEASEFHQRMAMFDMNMLAMPGGRDRTEAEFRALFSATRFALERILPLPDFVGLSLLEAVPR